MKNFEVQRHWSTALTSFRSCFNRLVSRLWNFHSFSTFLDAARQFRLFSNPHFSNAFVIWPIALQGSSLSYRSDSSSSSSALAGDSGQYSWNCNITKKFETENLWCWTETVLDQTTWSKRSLNSWWKTRFLYRQNLLKMQYVVPSFYQLVCQVLFWIFQLVLVSTDLQFLACP